MGKLRYFKTQGNQERGNSYTINTSSYALNFAGVYGSLPEANKRPLAPFQPQPGKLDGKSEAKRVFDGSGQEGHF